MQHTPITNSRDAIRDFQRRLHRWYKAERRSLPWREETSLYRTVVSEFMCQQTQIATVIPYFERWMVAFPDFQALAAAPEASVLRHWEGLGYYRRAHYLHSVAKALNGAAAPRTADAWVKLPGIGPYTAAAIASIACGRAVACIDGNVVRILARMIGEETEFRNGTEAARHFTSLADALMDDDNPGTHNQAMMELGAVVCMKKNPLCTVCPVRSDCKAGSEGFAEDLPRIRRIKTVQQTMDRVWIIQKGRLLLHRRPKESSRLPLMHELPAATQVGIKPKSLVTGRSVTRRRTITHHRITETIHFRDSLNRAQKSAAKKNNCSWVLLKDLKSLALSGPHRRWVEEILAQVMDRRTP